MAHSDLFIFLNSITWVFFCFFFLYFCFILFILPLFYKQLRLRTLFTRMQKKSLLGNIQEDFNKFWLVIPTISEISVISKKIDSHYSAKRVMIFDNEFFKISKMSPYYATSVDDTCSVSNRFLELYHNSYTFNWNATLKNVCQLNIITARSLLISPKFLSMKLYDFADKNWKNRKLWRLHGWTISNRVKNNLDPFCWQFLAALNLNFLHNFYLVNIDWSKLSIKDWKIVIEFFYKNQYLLRNISELSFFSEEYGFRNIFFARVLKKKKL